jgi:hypothetical protein
MDGSQVLKHSWGRETRASKPKPLFLGSSVMDESGGGESILPFLTINSYFLYFIDYHNESTMNCMQNQLYKYI